MAVGRVDDEDVDPRGTSAAAGSSASLPTMAAADAKATRGRLWWPAETGALHDVFDRDEPAQHAVVVDDRELLDAVLRQDLLGLIERGADGAATSGGRRMTRSIFVVDVVDEAQVTVGEQTEQMTCPDR